MRTVFLSVAFFLVGLTQVSQAASLVYLGERACRKFNGQQGDYDYYANKSWKSCVQLCKNDDACLGVEMTLFKSGRSDCEIHFNPVHAKGPKPSDRAASCWAKPINVP